MGEGGDEGRVEGGDSVRDARKVQSSGRDSCEHDLNEVIVGTVESSSVSDNQKIFSTAKLQ